jgi:branched-chain amino acid transport system permease protein
MGVLYFFVYLMIMANVYGILSLSLNFQAGVGGMSNFGHVAFFCIGAYTSTLLVMLCHVHFLVGILGAFIASGLFAFLISIPTRRLKADYWAITTLGAGEIVRLFFLNESWISTGHYSGGPFGIRGIPRPWESIIPGNIYPFFYLFLTLLSLGLTYFILQRLINGPFGRVLKAIREDDDLPLSLGKNIHEFRVKTMVIGGAFAGIAGGLLVHYTTYVDPFFFMPMETFIVWAMIMVGGIGNNRGALIGTLIIQLLYYSTRFLKDYLPIEAQLLASLRMISIGILIVVVMLFLQEGLVKEKKRLY